MCMAQIVCASYGNKSRSVRIASMKKIMRVPSGYTKVCYFQAAGRVREHDNQSTLYEKG